MTRTGTSYFLSCVLVLLWSFPGPAQEPESDREKAAPKSGAQFAWTIVGPDKPAQHPCGDTPPTPYMVTARPEGVQSARVLHVIWHKTAVGIPTAIDRVIIDTDADEAASKTPHLAHFFQAPRHSPLGGD